MFLWKDTRFTWFKSLGTTRAIEEHFDKALANNTWFNFFPRAILENLDALVQIIIPFYFIALLWLDPNVLGRILGMKMHGSLTLACYAR